VGDVLGWRIIAADCVAQRCEARSQSRYLAVRDEGRHPADAGVDGVVVWDPYGAVGSRAPRPVPPWQQRLLTPPIGRFKCSRTWISPKQLDMVPTIAPAGWLVQT
jgi:hypothetical protein